MLRLLVAVDGSDNAMRAVRQVAAMARRGLTLEAVLCTVQPPGRSHADGNATLAPGIAELARAGLRVLTHQATGQPVEEIARAASGWHTDAIVVGRRGHGAPTSASPGSVATRLACESSLPVVVVS